MDDAEYFDRLSGFATQVHVANRAGMQFFLQFVGDKLQQWADITKDTVSLTLHFVDGEAYLDIPSWNYEDIEPWEATFIDWAMEFYDPLIDEISIYIERDYHDD